jgi:hypothetical protein
VSSRRSIVAALILSHVAVAGACQQTSRDRGAPPATGGADARSVAPTTDAAAASGPGAGDATDAGAPRTIDAAVAAMVPLPVPTGLPPFGRKAGANTVLARSIVELLGTAETGPREYGDLPGGWPTGDYRTLPASITDRDPSDPADELALAIAAVEADPGLPAARVAIARVVRDDAFRLAQLAPLAAASPAACPDCVDELLDVDFADESPAVAALIAKVKPSRARVATMAFQQAWAANDLASVKRMFTAPRVRYLVDCSNCDEDSKPRFMSGAKVRAELEGNVEEARRNGWDETQHSTSSYLRCRKDCCATFTAMLGHSSDYFHSICFAPGTDRIIALTIVAG